jgi:hypothetical protein
MADLYTASSEAINLAAATALVVLDVASTGTTRRSELVELSVTFNGITASAVPVTVRLVRTTVAPVGGGTITQAATPLDPNSPPSLCTAYMPTTASPGVYATTAPTVGAIIRTWYIPPTSGIAGFQFPLGQEPKWVATAGTGLGIQCVAPAIVAVTSNMVWAE